MKNFSKIFTLVSAICFALVGSARAQLVTYETVSDYSGTVQTFSNSGKKLSEAELFTNVSAIASLTYNFFSTSPSAPGGTLSATFGEWNTSTNSFVGSTLSFGTITVPATNLWTQTVTVAGTPYSTFTATFDFGSVNNGNLVHTNPASTYALLLTNTSGTVLNWGLGATNDDGLFAYGTGVFASGLPPDADWTFSQIILVPEGNIVPIPEASTVASIAGAVLVAGLAALRLRQRRQLATVPVAA